MESGGPLAQSAKAGASEGGYYDTVYALTPKQDVQSAQTAASQTSPAIPVGPVITYAPFIIFFALFIGAFGIQVVNRALSIRRIISAFVIALFVASTPFVLSSVREGTRFQSKAGPEETPRQVTVNQVKNEFQVVWQTDSETIGAVRIGVAPLIESEARVIIADDGKPSRDHTVSLGSLKRGYVYEYEVYSSTRWYDQNGQPLLIDLRAGK